MSRAAQLKKNTIWSLTYEVLTIICGFILPRYFLLYYGTDVNGLQGSITHFLGFIALCELGLGAVIPASLYKPLADNDMCSVSKIYVSSQKFYNVIGIVMLLYVGVLVAFYPSLIGNSFDFLYTGSLILIIAISTIAQYFFGITNTLLLRADQKQYIPLIVNSVTLIISTILSVVFIVSEFSIHAVKLLASIIFIVRPLFLNWYVRKHYNINSNITYIEEPIKQKWNGVAQHLAYTVQDKTGVIILTTFSSLANVSIFGIYYMLINGMRGLLYSLTGGVSSYLGNVLAKGETALFNKTFTLFELTFHVLTVIVFGMLSVVVVGFVDIYTTGVTDAEIYHVPLFADLFCIAVAFRCLQLPYNTVVQTVGHFRETQNSAIIEPVINIIVSIAMVYKFGLIGIACGTLASMLYRFIYLSFYVDKKILNCNNSRLIKICFFDVICYIVIVSLSRLLVFEVSTPFVNWMIHLVVSGIVAISTVVVLILFLYPSQISSLLKVLKNGKKRK